MKPAPKASTTWLRYSSLPDDVPGKINLLDFARNVVVRCRSPIVFAPSAGMISQRTLDQNKIACW